MLINVQKGDIVDIIFPATGCSSAEILAIKNYVEKELDLTPRILFENEQNLTTENPKNEFPISDKKHRFLQLQEALENQNSKIVWCGRGGYGSGDLLPMLEEIAPIKQNKLFIGFSDIVSIASFFQDRWNWKIICAPVLTQLARGDIEKDGEKELKELIFGEKTEFSYDVIALNQIENPTISGEISGGCLSVLCGHFGGKYQINFANKILFLEDEGEDGERLDRYFRQIIEVILKDKTQIPKAILLGNFLQSNPHGTPKAENIEKAIKNFVQRIADFSLKIPIFADKNNNLGHSSKMRPLILGQNAEFIGDGKNYKLTVKS